MISLLLALAFSAERDALSLQLMKHPAISESTLAPYVSLRNQPQRIYRRYESDASRYDTRCGKRFEQTQGRYYRIRYQSIDGLFVEAIVGLPVDFDPAKTYPAVIHNRGNWEEGQRFTYCSTAEYENYTRAGYLILATQYRGVNGSEGRDEWGGADVGDVLAITQIAHDLTFIDDVFMVGNSRGGMMTYMALRAGAKVKAAVVNCGLAEVSPETLTDDVLARVLAPDLPEAARAAEYRSRSAVEWADELKTPLLIAHGGKDVGVPVAGTRKLVERLVETKLEHRFLLYPEAGHCGENYPESYQTDVLAWFASRRE